MSATVVTSSDRLSFTLFLALLIHALVILGISFTASDSENLSKTLEVTLANYKSDKAPEEADYIAQANQEGSGTLDEAKMLTTDVEADFQSNAINEASPQEQQASAPKKPQGQQQTVTTSAETKRKVSKEQTEPALQLDIPDGPQKSLLERSLEMASLEAKLDTLRQTYAKKPRVQRLTAMSTMAASDAYYVNSWRRKIEQMGALNYPREAENCFDNCRLRLLVAINPDGTIRELNILESSGRKVLDDAALRIVRMSAPFAPFTEEMRKDIDVLEIIRTWQFKGNRYLSESN
ncbi:MAG: energy transducer TonB [Oceanospirillaceae bacterium]|uniref:energy transducer TonB n=1 Tax=unclassified Thalassolituus TaxID=2624967 RepID=UPI000C08E8D2|nr:MULTISPECIES: energy transducer TonB [unclassified Thalassolituus]MAK90415.1 energy transducer TonB [Thalassolituus sp.]MAS26203.1 energy transducer TonB [Oceanospirillaceae bacterium]MAX98908.1 energy transducer TonB [Oceanospirillaceae bacterium]MBL33315.1 energy transducer TonB [Oceanospirillaceae bacterium]MBS54393.1 energy transducer TonB [Oceanospirillaceae bacterium]|tara:strand:- start:6968 stop:7843 length:876 start_codon:yes stop_codon:yes gene_type:complete